MSSRIETLNRGGVDEFGFIFTAERVGLGALPSMPIDQFAQYSVDTLIQIASSEETPQDLKEKIKLDTAFMYGRVIQANMDHNSSSLKQDPDKEFIKKAEISISNTVSNLERNYPQNPFDFKDRKIAISNFYDVSLPEFTAFAMHILGGGLFGWTTGVPEAIKTNAGRFMKAVNPTI